MFLSQLKAAAAVVLAVVALGAGAGGLMVPAAAADGERPAKSSVQSDGTITVAGDRVSLAGWGEIIDPSQDCTFHQAGDRLKITLPGSDHGLSVEMNRMNAPRVLRAVQGDFIAQVKVSGGLPQGATSVVSGRRPFHGAGLLVWKDEKTYIRLERAGLVFEEKNYAYGNWELRRDGEFVRAGNTGDMPFNDLEPRWLRLERRGDVMYGSIGTDGNQWAALEPIEVKLPGKLLVGVVAGHNTSSGFAPVFEGLRIYQALR